MGVLIEPLGIGFHAILRKPPKKTDKVLIYGAGIIGMTCLVALKYLYPDVKAYVIARHDFQKQLAEKLGGIVLQDHSYEKIAEITQGHLYKGSLGNKMILGGFDLLIDCVGSGTTMNNGLRWTRSGGTIILVGLHLFKTRIDLSPVWYQEINVLGSSGSGLETYNNQEIHTHDLVIKMLQSGFIDVDDFITHKFHLDKYKEALKVATNKKKSKAVKVLFDFRL